MSVAVAFRAEPSRSRQVVELPALRAVEPCGELLTGEREDHAVALLAVAHLDTGRGVPHLDTLTRVGRLACLDPRGFHARILADL